MIQANTNSLSKLMSSNEVQITNYYRWHQLCEQFLPIDSLETIWRFSRESIKNEPSQGWKLHLSATILEACDLFQKVAPFLISENIQFKAPKSLEELTKINCGLEYGYWQVGKFITVYPPNTKSALYLAKQLHNLTLEFNAISVPFDNQYLSNSSVFYRFGAFHNLELIGENGEPIPAIKDKKGNLVYDDRFQPFPEWIDNPFPKTEASSNENSTPLTNVYKVFRAISQRGKGGAYQALDISRNPPRFCFVKEGRRYGEVNWNQLDGYALVKNEAKVIESLEKVSLKVPRFYSSFEIEGNSYLVTEFIEGQSLFDLMKFRRRRFSIKQIIKLAIAIAEIIIEINNAGWVWNDCKPSNLIITSNNDLRPVDFEGAYPIDQKDPFEWKTEMFAPSAKNRLQSKPNDLYSLGAVVFFLLTGKFYDSNETSEISKYRRNVPLNFQEIIKSLLDESLEKREMTVNLIKEKFEIVLRSI